jgi:S1-C subfamily serine protease
VRAQALTRPSLVELRMISRPFLVIVALTTTATSFFLLGVFHSRTNEAADRAAWEAQLDALRTELRNRSPRTDEAGFLLAGTSGVADGPTAKTHSSARAAVVAEIKRELQDEMGLLPLQLLRERRSSFVELHTADNTGRTSYGTAGYLGAGYFVTVKHAVVALDESGSDRKIVSIKVLHDGTEIPAELVDAGDAKVEVHSGDWAVIKTRELDLPPLRPNTSFPYEFAEPIFRLGNDYSKGIIVSTGYVGQRIANGLVTCLTDGHPGASGGGVINREGELVGIPIGRMQGDYRFSFILPLRDEMFRKIPALAAPLGGAGPTVLATSLP